MDGQVEGYFMGWGAIVVGSGESGRKLVGRRRGLFTFKSCVQHKYILYRQTTVASF